MSNASYLKLKDKISKLEKDINTLVFHPESMDANLIRARKGFRRDVEKTMLLGRSHWQTPEESIKAFTQ